LFSIAQQAQTECQLNDPVFGTGECSTLVIDGKDAAANGYPNVTLSYTMKLCNYNDNNVIRLATPPSQTQFYFPIPGSGGEERFIIDESYNDQILRPGQCEEALGSFRVSTSRSKYFMNSHLQGLQTSESSGSQNGFCFAYSLNKIDFKYDYGFGDCKFSVSFIYFGSYCFETLKFMEEFTIHKEIMVSILC
jgi:hypothetical protein